MQNRLEHFRAAGEFLERGGYFAAVEDGFFVDSGMYPERNGDGIARKINGGIGVGTIVKRDKQYMAPVTAHYGYNNVQQYGGDPANPSALIGGCTLECPEKIIYIDELDDTDNVNVRMAQTKDFTPGGKKIRPEMEWLADGTVMLTMFFPAPKPIAEAAALECAKRMNLTECEVISREIMHPQDGTRIEVKGKVPFEIDVDSLVIPKEPDVLSDDVIRADIERRPMKIVAATVGEDEHSVGLREIIDIKHGGIEKYGMEVIYLGTSCPCEKLVDAAIEVNADAIMASTIISHDDIHYKNIAKIDQICREKGIRDKIIFIAGGTQVTPELARQAGADEGFGRGSHGVHNATFLVKKRWEMEKEGKL